MLMIDMVKYWQNLKKQCFDINEYEITDETKDLQERLKDLNIYTLDIDGVIVGLAHGHQFRTGGKYSHQKAVAWLSGQAFGKTDIGDVDILLSGHFHHLFVINEGQRTLMQAPSVDGGSEWFANLTGRNSFSGVLTFTIKNKENKLPWDNIQVL